MSDVAAPVYIFFFGLHSAMAIGMRASGLSILLPSLIAAIFVLQRTLGPRILVLLSSIPMCIALALWIAVVPAGNWTIWWGIDEGLPYRYMYVALIAGCFLVAACAAFRNTLGISPPGRWRVASSSFLIAITLLSCPHTWIFSILGSVWLSKDYDNPIKSLAWVIGFQLGQAALFLVLPAMAGAVFASGKILHPAAGKAAWVAICLLSLSGVYLLVDYLPMIAYSILELIT